MRTVQGMLVQSMHVLTGGAAAYHGLLVAAYEALPAFQGLFSALYALLLCIINSHSH